MKIIVTVQVEAAWVVIRLNYSNWGVPRVGVGRLAQTLTLVPHLTNTIKQHHTNQSTFNYLPHASGFTHRHSFRAFWSYPTKISRTLDLDWRWAHRGHSTTTISLDAALIPGSGRSLVKGNIPQTEISRSAVRKMASSDCDLTMQVQQSTPWHPDSGACSNA